MIPSREILKEKCQGPKRKNKDFLLNYGYQKHRDISIFITAFMLRYMPSIKPNHVSYLMLVVGFIGSLALISSSLVVACIGLLLIYISFLLDKVDGELARYKEEYSIVGMYLDELYHICIPLWMFGFLFCNVFLSSHFTIMAYVLMLILMILVRYHRKVLSNIKIKSERSHIDQSHYKDVQIGWLKKVSNFLPLRAGSIVERLDILILFSVVVIFLDMLIFVEGIKIYALYFIVLLYVAAFIRFALRSVSGEIVTLVKGIK